MKTTTRQHLTIANENRELPRYLRHELADHLKGYRKYFGAFAQRERHKAI
jgi:hypothetical protein